MNIKSEIFVSIPEREKSIPEGISVLEKYRG
jgi:hypothetical protein